jgi:NAD(P)H-quinone oxidoreductase subunit 5
MILPLSLLSPAILLFAGLIALLRPGTRPGGIPRLAEGAALLSLACAAAGAVGLATAGAASAPGFLQDALSATMALLVAFIGWVVVRYARSYLDGEPREGAFHAAILATTAAVLVLVQAGDLLILVAASVAVGAGLRWLLLFYRERPGARRAAAKFRLVWGIGDMALILAALLLWVDLGTTGIAAIRDAAAGGMTLTMHLAVALLVLAALVKTAAFPLHGWLTEVMEAPTPVSALLHAGIINAGGFLMLRMADLVQANPGAMAVLVMAGGFSALFGAAVMLTQSAVKTALAWSTVAQMGFLLLQCGLGLWSLALLHIVAHSLYKAHAFLSSGGAVRSILDTRRPGPVAVPSGRAVALAFGIALAIYSAVAVIFGLVFAPKSAQALALGAILVFGVAYLVAQGLADAAPAALTRRTALASAGAATSYFLFHLAAGALFGASLPAPPVPGALEWALLVLALLSFGTVAVAQALFPHWAHHPSTAGLRVHLANGLYINAALDRMIGGFRTAKPL